MKGGWLRLRRELGKHLHRVLTRRDVTKETSDKSNLFYVNQFVKPAVMSKEQYILSFTWFLFILKYFEPGIYALTGNSLDHIYSSWILKCLFTWKWKFCQLPTLVSCVHLQSTSENVFNKAWEISITPLKVYSTKTSMLHKVQKEIVKDIHMN